MREGLAESESRIGQHQLAIHSSEFRGAYPVGKEGSNLGNHLTITRGTLHRAGLALHVHQANRHSKFGRGGECTG
jgi:hypothetical protein